MTPPSDRALLSYLEGEVTASEAAEIAASLEAPANHRRLEALRGLVEDLGADPDIEGIPARDIDLAASVRAGADEPAPGRSRRPGRIATAAAAGFAALAAILVAIAAGRQSPGDPIEASARTRADSGPEAFRAKTAAPNSDRWVALDVYRVADSGTPERFRGEIRTEDGLLFAYRNAAEPPFSHLMVFAVAPGGRVHWYYPAYSSKGEDPSAIPIAATDARAAELPDLVHHDYAPGRLSLYGLFLSEPLSVSAIEGRVAELAERDAFSADRLPRLPVPGSGQHRIAVEVSR